MKRRKLLQQLPARVAAPSLVRAQSGPKPLVVLTALSKANVPADFETQVQQVMTRLGWHVGDNLRLEFRYADNPPERLDAPARELVALQPTAALTVDEAAVRALLRHTKQVPMVVAFAPAAVASGLAASLRRPGGQVTGSSLQFADIRPKTYELARQLAPSARRLVSLFDRRFMSDLRFDVVRADSRRDAQRVGLEFVPLPARDAPENETALRSLTPAREPVLLITPSEMLFTNFGSTAALARTLHLPTGSQHMGYVRASGLFGYGADLAGIGPRAVQMADQVLRGQPVGEIPFEQPTRIMLTLNRETARKHRADVLARAAAAGGRGDRLSVIMPLVFTTGSEA